MPGDARRVQVQRRERDQQEERLAEDRQDPRPCRRREEEEHHDHQARAIASELESRVAIKQRQREERECPDHQVRSEKVGRGSAQREGEREKRRKVGLVGDPFEDEGARGSGDPPRQGEVAHAVVAHGREEGVPHEMQDERRHGKHQQHEGDVSTQPRPDLRRRLRARSRRANPYPPCPALPAICRYPRPRSCRAAPQRGIAAHRL
jgi:hypothetical protein